MSKVPNKKEMDKMIEDKGKIHPKFHKSSPKVKKAIGYANAFYEQFLQDCLKMNKLELYALSKSDFEFVDIDIVLPIIQHCEIILQKMEDKSLTQFMKGDDI